MACEAWKHYEEFNKDYVYSCVDMCVSTDYLKGVKSSIEEAKKLVKKAENK